MKTTDIYRKHLSEGELLRIEQIEKEAAETPPSDQGLAIYVGAIETLRGKGYSYRGIADWFNERGFKVNHVDVWRAHKNSLQTEDLMESAQHDPEWTEFVSKETIGNNTTYTEKDLKPEDAPKSPRQVKGLTPKAKSRKSKGN